jgi:predicted DNA-binding transcriptional regulator YafY
MKPRKSNHSWTPTRPVLRRLLWYAERLRAGRGFTAPEAASALEVSERTVLRDMEYARTLDWDVAFCRQRRRWALLSGLAPLPLARLREGEAVALLVAEEALRAYAGSPYAEALRAAFEKLDAVLDAPVTLDLNQVPLPGFTGPPARPVAAAQYEQVYRACEKQRRLEIVYHSLERDEVTTRRIDPHHLFAYAGDWYVIAWDERRSGFRTFALGERMREVRETGESFARDEGFDAERYMAEGFGLFRGGEVEGVVLKFSPAVARYLKEKVWAPAEEQESLPDGGLLLRFPAPVNVGLLRFVLQYGAEVEVVAPEGLRQQVAEEHRRALAVYDLECAAGDTIPCLGHPS